MDPITIVLALAGIGVGFGANTVVAKRKLGSAQDQADKELTKAKKQASKLVEEAREEVDQQGGVAAAAAAQVYGLCPRLESDSPARLLQAHAQVGLFPVEEVVGVEAAHLAEGLGPHQQAGPQQPVYLVGPGVPRGDI